MNLSGLIFLSELDAIRLKMGAELISLPTIVDWSLITPVENIMSIDVIPTDVGGKFIGLDGKRIIVYIRDYCSYYGKPKFHITNCHTLKMFQSRNAYQKYVGTNNTNGNFELNIKDNSGRVISSKTEKLEVCKNCLKLINYKEYSKVDWNTKEAIYAHFNLKEYLKNSNAIQPQPPKHNEFTSPINIYPDDFKQIAQKLKEQKNWTCQQCNKGYNYDKGSLHVHHKNERKDDNSEQNLEVLCKYCHQNRHKYRIA